MTELFRAMLLWFKPRQRLGRLHGQNWDTIRRTARELGELAKYKY